MSAPQATVVANSFVKQYYGILAQKPDQLYKFYKAHSVFSFSHGAQSGGAAITVFAVGQEEIHGKIMATLRPFNGHSCKAEIIGIDSQESRYGGVLVLVTGYLVISGTAVTQHFTQSFFLDKQTQPYEGYFVLNDILRYLPPTAPGTGGPRQPSVQGPVVVPEAFFQAQAQALPGAPLAQVHPAMLPPRQWPQGRPAAQAAAVASWLQQAEQMPPPSESQDVPDDEADERVAEVSLDIEEEEEEEERLPEDEVVEDEEAEEAEEAQPQEAPASKEEGEEEVAEAEQPADVQEEAAAEEEGQQEEQEAPPHQDEQEGWVKAEEASPVGDDAGEQPDGGEDLSGYYVEEAPRTWATMAERLQQEGGGQLRASKVQGFACPAASRAAVATAASSLQSAASSVSGAQAKAGKSGSSSAVRPAALASNAASSVWLWVSRLPTDPGIDTQEVLDSLNGFLVEWGCEGQAVEVDRRELQQEWASIQVTSQEAADTLIALSRDGGLLLGGRRVKAELHRLTYTGPRRPGRSGASKGGGMAAGGREEERHEGGKLGDGKGGGRPRRKPRGPADGGGRYSPSYFAPSEKGAGRGYARVDK